jgi:formamidopyrimidine-DNA glycosylase
MPELPEVETICRALRPHLLDRSIVAVRATVPRLRTPLDVCDLQSKLVGRSIKDVRRRAKYLIVEVSGCQAIVLHLGMTGACVVCPADIPDGKYERVILTLSDGNSWRLDDIRRFGMFTVCPLPSPGGTPELLSSLGPEPFAPEFTGKCLREICRGRHTPIKVLLLDQNRLAGLGNIYVNEALFRAHISPLRIADSLSLAECRRIASHVEEVLLQAIEWGGTTISDYRSVDGTEGKFVQELRVYGRQGQPCLNCGAKESIHRIVQGGRATFYCPRCQK